MTIKDELQFFGSSRYFKTTKNYILVSEVIDLTSHCGELDNTDLTSNCSD
jgi:hypothetical protein